MSADVTLVIGLGNPDCADDGAGPLVASMLAERDLPKMQTLIRRGDALALLNDWSQYTTCIVVDAATCVSQPGKIYRIDAIHEPLPHDLSVSSTHAIGLADAVALAKTLGQLPQRLIIYAIEGCCFECGGTMTPEVAAAAPLVVERIEKELSIRQITGELSHA